MAHHKRRRPKNARAGCLLCKPWKINGFDRRGRADGQRFSDYRSQIATVAELLDDLEDICLAEQHVADLRAGRSETIAIEDLRRSLRASERVEST